MSQSLGTPLFPLLAMHCIYKYFTTQYTECKKQSAISEPFFIYILIRWQKKLEDKISRYCISIVIYITISWEYLILPRIYHGVCFLHLTTSPENTNPTSQ